MRLSETSRVNFRARHGVSAALRPFAGAFIFIFLVVGCSAPHAPDFSEPPVFQPSVEEATERTIVDAVSLDATAEAGTSFNVTAATKGHLTIEQRPTTAVSSVFGSRHRVHSLARAQITTAAFLVQPRPLGIPDMDNPAVEDEASEHLSAPDALSKTQNKDHQQQAGTQFDPQKHTFWFTNTEGEKTELSVPSTTLSIEVLVPLATPVPANTPLMKVTDSAIVLLSEPTATQVLRIGARTPKQVRAQVVGSSGPFDCTATDQRLSRIESTLYFSCRAPESTPLVSGATARVVIQLDVKENVLALPVEAVAGSLTKGQVFLAENPQVPVSVELGISDGIFIEIVSGMKTGDRVVIPSPSILGDTRESAG